MKIFIIIMCSMVGVLILSSCTRIIKGVGYLFWQGNTELRPTPEEKMYTHLFANYIFLIEHDMNYQLYSYNQTRASNYPLIIAKPSIPCRDSFLVQLTKKNISATNFINLLYEQYLLTGNQNINIIAFNKMPNELRALLESHSFKIVEINSCVNLMGSYKVKQISSEYLYNKTSSHYLYNKERLTNTHADSLLHIKEKTNYQYRIWLPEEIVLSRRYKLSRCQGADKT